MEHLTGNRLNMPILPVTLNAKAGSCGTATACLLIAFTALYCTFQPVVRMALPVSHDIGFHLFQAGQFAGALGSGTIIPHWLGGANNGYGSPNFIFYSPLSYYFAASLNLLVGSIPVSMVISTWSAFFFSGIAMSCAAARLSGREGGLFAAILYQVLPFHLLDLYARGTFAELFAFAWFPLVILCTHGIFTAPVKRAYFSGLSLSYAGLILTHLVSGFIFTWVLGAYLLFNYHLHKDGKAFRLALFALAVGLGLSSFYLLPAVLERSFVHIDYIVKCSVGDYRQNFLFLLDGLTQGLRDFRLMLHAATLLELALFLALVLALSRNVKKKDLSQHSFFIMLFLIAFFLTIPLSQPVWGLVPGLPTLQFPWRWISMMELSLCFLLGRFISLREAGPGAVSGRWSRTVFYCLGATLLVSLVIVVRSDKTHPKDYAGYSVALEYTPKTVSDPDQLLAQKHVRVVTLSGVASSAISKWDAERRSVEVNALTPSMLRIGTSFYPGWEAEVDGVKTPVGIEKQSGAMLVRVPQGRHTLTLNFVDTPVRRLAKYLSLLSLATLLLYCLRQYVIGGFND
ncbi:6-pyruvoyl-tetrahydropterin synthase-related protein [Geomonas azotofigens]|uniref:6-pyruvoyl-tetrahydropterin synthase-related protein n=1 Tax=Geomonas azotofigens TaxID=2843196 RepID=UPI001C0FA174|nr:6-pyruvoyl-tetrahydropterin synthase-related protein [Geomonas azotofigens]MBU5612484.1 hypothetical protein [Geomonas azotofigens]